MPHIPPAEFSWLLPSLSHSMLIFFYLQESRHTIGNSQKLITRFCGVNDSMMISFFSKFLFHKIHYLPNVSTLNRPLDEPKLFYLCLFVTHRFFNREERNHFLALK